jgi:hypothetical protein
MKKVFAIIAILVVLVGAVFADAPATGYATLKVVTLVETFEPAFKLVTDTSDSGNLITASTTRAVFNQAANAAALASDTIDDDAYHVIAKNALVEAAGTTTVNFEVIQSAPSKSYKTYTLTATATDLIMVKAYNNSGDLVSYSGATAADHRVFEVVGGSNGTATVSNFAQGTAISGAQYELEVAGDSSASAFKFTYGGGYVPENEQIATFSCSWTNDVEGVPGQYEADVILHVTAN